MKKLFALLLALSLALPASLVQAATGCNFPTSYHSWSDKTTGDFLTVADVNQRSNCIENLQPFKGSADDVGYAFSAKKSRGSIASPTVITTGDDLLSISGYGYVGATNTYVEAARILLDSTGTISDAANGIGGIIRFSARVAGGNLTEIVNIEKDALSLLPHGTAAGNTGETRFLELAANGVNYIGFKAPDSIAANKIWVLPSADGTSGQLLSTNGASVLSWTAPGGLTREGSNDTEATSISTSTADLSVVSGLSIPVNNGIMIMASFRKTTGAAAGASFGLKLNSTQIIADNPLTDSTNAVENGGIFIWITPHDVSYTTTGVMTAATSTTGPSQLRFSASGVPNATITSVTITGTSGSSSVTIATNFLKVYRLAGT